MFTTIDQDGYPCYRRKDNGIFIEKNRIKLDNRNVDPYSPLLIMRYQGHVNMEYCNKSNSIKYLFKYVNKGPDKACLKITKSDEDLVIDEIQQYYDCRYISPYEVAWKIFEFDIHQRWPPIQRLTFHLFREQAVLFKDDDEIDDVLKNNVNKNTMFLAWFEANKKYVEGRTLTYDDFPTKFAWMTKQREWKTRKNGFSIGRLTFVPPGSGKLYYLRILLTNQTSCTDYDSIKTVNSVTYKMYQEACFAMGLLADDRKFIDAIKESSCIAYAQQLRTLFVTLLMMNTMTKPDEVWRCTWKLLCDDVLYKKMRELNLPGINKMLIAKLNYNSKLCNFCLYLYDLNQMSNIMFFPSLHIDDFELQNICLLQIDELLVSNGKPLKDFSCLPKPIRSNSYLLENRFLIDELIYDRTTMSEMHESLYRCLTAEQLNVYENIMITVHNQVGGFFFLYGYGGTGKTLSSGTKSTGMIVLMLLQVGLLLYFFLAEKQLILPFVFH